jgi:hypothetical protein
VHIGTVLTQEPGDGSVRRLLGTPPQLDPGRISALAHGLIVAGLIVVLLIAGREILEPLGDRRSPRLHSVPSHSPTSTVGGVARTISRFDR